jgi:hypothetical protein
VFADVFSFVSVAALPLVDLAAGLAVQRFGAERTFLWLGVATLVAGVASTLLPVLRELDRLPEFSAELKPTDLKPPVSEHGI